MCSREDGSVDYTNINALPNVKAGQKVAVYHQAIQSVDGCTVLGNVIPGKLYRHRIDKFRYLRLDIRFFPPDLQHSLMGLRLISAMDDCLEFCSITRTDSFHAFDCIDVTADDNGSTSLANLYAGGDIILSRGIQGGNRSKVTARGNVFADFIEHTTVEAGGTVQANVFMNYILDVYLAVFDFNFPVHLRIIELILPADTFSAHRRQIVIEFPRYHIAEHW